jgi:putative two-component system response regulator
VGKIGIPDRVLLKPGPLDPEEWEIMRNHTTLGASLLADSESPIMAMAEAIARTHHEKWDGSGYPAGLRGEEIPLAGRICAVCDVFDALLADRPYKKRWTVGEAVAEIASRSSTHFDPHLVAVFLDIAHKLSEELAIGAPEAEPEPALS